MSNHIRIRIACLFAWVLLAGVARAAGGGLTAAADLAAEARQAQRGGYPLVVLYSRRDCPYCETVRRDYLLPMLRQPRYRDRLIVRQVDIDSEAVLRDFAGNAVSHAEFARREKVKLVPVLAFYGPSGKPLAESIVGLRLADFYGAYLEDALQAGAR